MAENAAPRSGWCFSTPMRWDNDLDRYSEAKRSAHSRWDGKVEFCE